jgi:transcription elongation factor Elf1
MFTELEEEGIKFEPDYIKEKFGCLRVSLNWTSETLHEAKDEPLVDLGYHIIGKYEDKSLSVCEVCGKPGVLRLGGWIRTLCNAHAKDQKMAHYKPKPDHKCKHSWDTCPECNKELCSECTVACYNCVKAYRHQECAKKHMDETKHEGQLNDLVWLVSLSDHRTDASGIHYGF